MPELAKRKKKSEFIGKGALIQLLAIVLFFVLLSPLGVLVAGALALVLFIIGSAMSVKWVCGACGNKLDGKQVKICPVCKRELE